MRKIELILFDIDGTLIDSSDDIVCATNATLNELGLKEVSKEQIISFVGKGFEIFMKNLISDKDPKFFINAKKLFSKNWNKQCSKKAKVFDGAFEILEHFSDKIKGIVTNRRKEFAVMSLKSIGIYDKFQYVNGGDSFEELKPHPAAIEKALKAFSIDKQQAVIVGDMDVDIKAGKNAGILTCAVSYGLEEPEILRKLKPDYMVDTLLELKKIFY